MRLTGPNVIAYAFCAVSILGSAAGTVLAVHHGYQRGYTEHAVRHGMQAQALSPSLIWGPAPLSSTVAFFRFTCHFLC